MIGYQFPFLPKMKYSTRRLNCIFSEEVVKRSRRKSIIGQFLWSNGIGDWSTNLKQGPSSVRIWGQWISRALKNARRTTFLLSGRSRAVDALRSIPAEWMNGV